MNSDHQKLSHDVCDNCGQKCVGTMHYQRDSAVLFVCKHCTPRGFESQAREDIDRWLSGGSIR